MGWKDYATMQFGKHRNLKFEDVPDKYLLWVYEDGVRKDQKKMWEYLEENIDAIRANVERKKLDSEQEEW